MKKFQLGLVAVMVASAAIAEGDPMGGALIRDGVRLAGEEVASYRPALQSMATNPQLATSVKEALQRIDGLMAEARRLLDQGRTQEALTQAEAAKRLAINSVVRLGAGQTVTYSLSFATPQDEFAYELRRYDSNAMLIAMSLREVPPETGELHRRIRHETAEAARLKELAAIDAAAGRHPDAVRKMEAAVLHLTRALQALGVPVF